jgi:hypothetical protein
VDPRHRCRCGPMMQCSRERKRAAAANEDMQL